jgi:glycosyltransferase involved in cell wall biosynthesis
MIFKILVLTKYGSLGGSSRYRFCQYLPYLKSQGFDITVAPLLDNNYVTNFNSGKRNFVNVLFSYFQRLGRLITDRDYDLLWIEKEILPFFPTWFESFLIGNTPYVVDYDDAQFHTYDEKGSKLTKLFLSQKIDRVMAKAKIVVAGNEYIAQRARQAGASRIEIIPTVIDLDRYSPKTTASHSDGVFNIGWIGSPGTSIYLKTIQSAFQALTEKYNCQFTFVGAGNFKLDNLDLTVKKWQESSEVEDIKTFDVGIMPLNNTPWERGKCGIKLIQYMACALPVVGTPIGVNQDIIQHGVNGFQANTLDEWVDYLSKLATDPHLCKIMGAKGREMVESSYCLQVMAPRMSQLLRSCIRAD